MRLRTLEIILGALGSANVRYLVAGGVAEFADPEKRADWIEHKNMQVFSLESDTYPDTTVDIFAREPFDFEVEHAAAETHDLDPQVALPLVCLSTLIAMKQEAGRPRDQDDVEHLLWISDERDKAYSMSSSPDWNAATWEGSRRAQIRRNLRLTVRERLEALEDLTETSNRLAQTAHEAPTRVAEATQNVIPDSAAHDG